MTVLPFHNETRLLTSPENIEPIKIFGTYYIARKSFQGRPRCFFVTANLNFKKPQTEKKLPGIGINENDSAVSSKLYPQTI